MTRSRQTADWGSRAGLAKVIPSSVAVGSGTGSANTLGTVSFSGATSISLNGVFSSTYNNYRIVYNFSSFSSTANNFNLRMRVSGSDNTSSNYKYSALNSNSTSPWWDGNVSSGATQIVLHRYTRTDGLDGTIDVFNPFATAYTSIIGAGVNPNFNNSDGSTTVGSLTVTTSYDGFTLYPLTSQNMTGTISVYGYTN